MARNTKNKRGKQKKNNQKPAKTLEKSPGLWERQSTTVQHAICLFLLAAVSFTFFAPFHFKGMSLFAYDTVSFKAMSNEMTQYKEATGETALWSPNPFGGMPGYMISSPVEIAQLDDIPRALRSVIWPSSHFLFLLFGMYLLVYYLVKDKWASVMAAVAYGLTTYVPIIFVAGHNSKFITMAFAPWLVLSFVYALRKAGILSSLLFAMALAINLRAGHIQITYYVAFVMGIWWLVEGWGAFKENNLAKFGKVTGWLALGSVLGILMVAQPFLTNYEYKAYTIRGTSAGGDAGAGGLSWEYAMNWSQGVGELITLVISNAYGGSSGTGYWGPKPPTSGPHYVGGIIFLLALFAGFSVKKREVRALGIAAIIMTLFSLGHHFKVLNLFMFNYFPLFSSFRVPETWLGIVAMVLAIMAAYGLKEAIASISDRTGAWENIFKAIGVGVAVLLVLMLMKNAFFSFEGPNDRANLLRQVASQQPNIDINDPQVTAFVDRTVADLKTSRQDQYSDDALLTLFMLLGAGGTFLLYRFGKVPGVLASMLIVGLVTYDLGKVAGRYFSEDRLTTESRAEDLVPEYGFDTYLKQKKAELGGNGHFRVLSLEGNLVEVARPAFHYETLSGYHGAKLRNYQDYLENILFDDNGLPNANGMDLLNTRYVVARGRLPGANVVYQDESTGMFVNERPNALPRAYFVGETEVVESAEATWSRIQDPAFDLGNTAILPTAGDVTSTPIDSTSTVSVALKKHDPHNISWDVSTDASRLLVVSEIYYPAGWKAFLDGEEVPIHRVNYLLRGVQIPAGDHELEMRFDPQSYKLGYWISFASTLLVYGGVLLLVGMGYMRKRQEQEEAQV